MTGLCSWFNPHKGARNTTCTRTRSHRNQPTCTSHLLFSFPRVLGLLAHVSCWLVASSCPMIHCDVICLCCYWQWATEGSYKKDRRTNWVSMKTCPRHISPTIMKIKHFYGLLGHFFHMHFFHIHVQVKCQDTKAQHLLSCHGNNGLKFLKLVWNIFYVYFLKNYLWNIPDKS